MSSIGWTGTQKGMTPLQKASAGKLLIELRMTELHHGDCIGADEEIHDFALFLRRTGVPQLRIVIHPPQDESKRAFCKGADLILPPKTHFARNRDIVVTTEITVGASIADHPLDRGGTWYTLNYARPRRDSYAIWPNGTVSFFLRQG